MKMCNLRIPQYLLHAVLILAMACMLLFPVNIADFQRYVTETRHYERATVEQIVLQELTESDLGTGQQLGQQTLRARMADGEVVTVENYLTDTHNVLVREGQQIILCVDAPENIEPYYTIYNYNRQPVLLALIGVFLMLMLLVGGKKGVHAAIAILFTLLFLLRVTLPAIYSGASPLLWGFLTVILSTLVTLVLLHGFTRQCVLGFMVTMAGECAACALFAVFSSLLHLTGLQTENAEGLLLIAQSTGMQVRTLLFTGMMLASLGAVMDVAVSILSALREVAGCRAPGPAGTVFRGYEHWPGYDRYHEQYADLRFCGRYIGDDAGIFLLRCAGSAIAQLRLSQRRTGTGHLQHSGRHPDRPNGSSDWRGCIRNGNNNAGIREEIKQASRYEKWRTNDETIDQYAFVRRDHNIHDPTGSGCGDWNRQSVRR